MCGISGIYHYGCERVVSEESLRRMTALLSHRGPDDEGHHLEGPVGLGVRRLSIIDLEGGHQPIANEDGSLHIVFNGEIYNYRSLRPELEARGHRFTTRTDTEVILHLYEEYGVGCLEYLRGMFAFCVLDRPRQRLFLARDRLGVKPVYYADGGGTLVFASEIKAILEADEVSREVEPRALELYLTFRYVPEPLTMFRGIYKLPAAHWLVCDRSGVTVKPYWDLSYEPKLELSDAEAAEMLRELFRDSVRLEMQSDVPVGAFLSGGIDSSSIVATMSEMSSSPVRTFSVGFEEGGATNELAAASEVAAHFGTVHTEVLLNQDDFVAVLPDFIWHQDEPLADASAIPLYHLSRKAHDSVKVVLTGEGADELFAGYHRHYGELLVSRFPRLPHLLAGSWYATVIDGGVSSRKANKGLKGIGIPDPSDRITWWHSVMSSELKAALLGASSSSDANRDGAVEHVRRHLDRADAISTFDQLAYVDTKMWLPGDLLMKKDKMGMAASIETRVPFLDHKLVEFATRLPVRQKIRLGQSKRVLREAMKDVLPAATLRRRKLGFVVPTAALLKGKLQGFVRDVLFSDVAARRPYFDASAVRSLVEAYDRGAPYDQVVFQLICFELWHRRFIDRDPG